MAVYITDSTKGKIFCTDINNLIKLNVTNWNNNRQPDETRVRDIAHYFISHTMIHVPGMLHIWHNTKDNSYSIYDGAHRFYASILSKRLNMKCVVEIISGRDSSCILDEFITLNKNIYVPIMYLDKEASNSKLAVCTAVVDKLQNQYPMFCKSTRSYWKGNYNRDIFIEEVLSKLEISFEKPGVAHNILRQLDMLNNSAKLYIDKEKIRHKNVTKCNNYKFWLFFFSLEHIKNYLNDHL